MKIYKSNVDVPEDFLNSYFGAAKAFAPCPVCNKNRFKIINIADRHNISLPVSMCQTCGMVTTNPRPDAAWYDEFYLKYFWQVYVGNNAEDLDSLFINDHYAFKGERIGSLILQEMTKPACNYLDVGCGLGGLVKYLRQIRPHWNIDAIEPSASAADYTMKHGVNVINAGFDQFSSKDKKYDFISLVHVLEHCLDPVEMLVRLAGLLAEGGMIYVEIPDLMSGKWKGKDYFHIAHVHYFDTEIFKLLVRQTPLLIKRITPSPVPEYWPWATAFFLVKNTEYVTGTDKITPLTDKEVIVLKEQKITGQINQGGHK